MTTGTAEADIAAEAKSICTGQARRGQGRSLPSPEARDDRSRLRMSYGRAAQSPLPSRRYGASAPSPPPACCYGASAPSPPPARQYAAGRNDQREDEAKNRFIRGMMNTFTAMTNQVVRISGGLGRNQGWPYFDRTLKKYPAFKRKFRMYQNNYHRLTPQRELVQMFREMCLPERVAARI
jgi:hypothetical protein